MVKDLKQKTINGILWTSCFKVFSFGVHFIGSVVIARLLFPEDFGLIGLAMIVVRLARRLANFGVNTALVQRKEVKAEHLDSVFIFNMAMMGLVALGIILFSSHFANFFNNNELTHILIVIAFLFILEASYSVPRTILIRKMRFKELEIGNAIGDSMSSLSPIGFAFMGFGVWSLVFGILLGVFTKTVAFYYYTGWYPKLKFRLWAFKDVFSFGIWVFISNSINYLNSNIDYFFIGKFLNVSQFGYYERAFNIMDLSKKLMGRGIYNVLLSTYSRIQDDNEKIVRGLLKNIAYISFLTYPLMIWMFFVAPSLITIVYGPKWINTIYPLQIMCVAGLVNIMTMVFYPVLTAKGLVKERSYIQIIFFIILLASVSSGIKFGINGVAIGVTFSYVLFFLMLSKFTLKKILLPCRKCFSHQIHALVYGLSQAAVLYLLQLITQPFFSNDSWQMLVSVSFFSFIVYFGTHFLIRFKIADEIFKELKLELKKNIHKIPIINRLSIK